MQKKRIKEKVRKYQEKSSTHYQTPRIREANVVIRRQPATRNDIIRPPAVGNVLIFVK
jgi:hypothetical protein